MEGRGCVLDPLPDSHDAHEFVILIITVGPMQAKSKEAGGSHRIHQK
jgi:hypothetical protein